MYRNMYLLNRQFVLAAALALGASSVALADDSSMNPFIGDSYRYFNGGHNVGDRQFKGPVFSAAPADPSWRQSHPNGLSERDLQALSSSSVSAVAAQLNPPVLASAPADPNWRQSHQNLGERQLQALSSSSVSRWQLQSGPESLASVPVDQANVAQNPSKEALAARLARILHSEGGTRAGAN